MIENATAALAEPIDAPAAPETAEAAPEAADAPSVPAPDPAPEPESEEAPLAEIEHEGETFRVPAALKGAFLRQSDYTRKTQELAEARRAFEAEQAGIREAGDAELAARADLLAFDRRLAAMRRIDWESLHRDSPDEARRAELGLRRLADARAQAATSLQNLEQQRTLETQRETARRIEEGRRMLARDIEGWNDALGASLIETGVTDYGFEKAEIETLEDPRMVKVLHDAHLYRQSLAKAEKAQAHVAAQAARPAARVGGSSPPPGLDDRLTTDEWLRRRERQLRTRRG